MNENVLIHRIIDRMRITLSLAGEKFSLKLLNEGNAKRDGMFSVGKVKRIFEIKKTVTKPLLLSFIWECRNTRRMLFTEYLSESLARELLKNGIEFADLAGNLFLKLPEHTFLIMNSKKPKGVNEKRSVGRAFSPSGLKLLFILLTEPDLLNANYRVLQERSGVSLGSIGYIMADLKNSAILLELDGILRFADKKKLMERWSLAYSEKLRGKLNIQRYFSAEINWNVKLLDGFPAAWGGEAAAHFIDKRLHPEIWSIYRWGNINKLIYKAKLRPDPQGQIEILEAFWPIDGNGPETVHPLLIYADLIASGDSRNLEAAMEIQRKYLLEK
jgi:hypothetical protein